MLRRFFPLFAHLLRFAPDTGATGGNNGQPKRSSGLGPEAIEPAADRETQLRRQAKATARTLAIREDERARDQSAATGKTVLPEKTATEEELYQALLAGDTSAHDTPAHLTTGPNPGVAELRPGESRNGPATGNLLVGGLVPEHQLLGANAQPTINAPGVGADSGLKKTADNPDARAGQGGHATGVDPADPGTQGAIGTAPERHDTAQETAQRVANAKELYALIASGEVPTREQFLEAGCPESEVDNATAGAKAQVESQRAAMEQRDKAREQATGENGAPAPATTSSAPNNTASPAPAPEKQA